MGGMAHSNKKRTRLQGSGTRLKTRPLFHVKEGPIQLLMLVCLMALPYLNPLNQKANTSLRAFLSQCKKATDACLPNKLTGNVIALRIAIPDDHDYAWPAALKWTSRDERVEHCLLAYGYAMSFVNQGINHA